MQLNQHRVSLNDITSWFNLSRFYLIWCQYVVASIFPKILNKIRVIFTIISLQKVCVCGVTSSSLVWITICESAEQLRFIFCSQFFYIFCEDNPNLISNIIMNFNASTIKYHHDWPSLNLFHSKCRWYTWIHANCNYYGTGRTDGFGINAEIYLGFNIINVSGRREWVMGLVQWHH